MKLSLNRSLRYVNVGAHMRTVILVIRQLSLLSDDGFTYVDVGEYLFPVLVYV